MIFQHAPTISTTFRGEFGKTNGETKGRLMVAETTNTVPGWTWLLTLLVSPAAAVLVAYFTTRPAYRVSNAERDVKLVTQFVELMGRAHGRTDRPVGVGEQNAAIEAVSEMGKRHDVLFRPALVGLRSMNAHYSQTDKDRLEALGDALRTLEAKAQPGRR